MNISDFSINLRRGAGNGDPRDGVCLMQVVDWFSGADKLSDQPECASPVLCHFGICLNDLAPTQKERDSLWPLVWQLLDSRDSAAEAKRIEHIVREITHRIVAPLFDGRWPTHARALRVAQSMREIQAAARAAGVVAWETAATAARAAGMAAWETAATAARTAGAGARAAERADAATAAAAIATAVAAMTPGFVWQELQNIFLETIHLGKHGECDPIHWPRAIQLQEVVKATQR